jgi:hypothetical protein
MAPDVSRRLPTAPGWSPTVDDAMPTLLTTADPEDRPQSATPSRWQTAPMFREPEEAWHRARGMSILFEPEPYSRTDSIATVLREEISWRDPSGAANCGPPFQIAWHAWHARHAWHAWPSELR